MFFIFKIALKGPGYIGRRLSRKIFNPLKKVSQKIFSEYIKVAEDLMQRNNYNQALKIWKKLIRLSPSPGVYVRLAECYEAVNEIKKAKKTFNSAIEKYPGDIKIYKAFFLFTVKQKLYKKSTFLWQKISDNFDSSIKIKLWPLFCKEYINAKQFTLAEDIIKDGLVDFPEHRELLVFYASIAMSKKNYKLALSRWNIILSKYNKDPYGIYDSRTSLARYYSQILPLLIDENKLKNEIKNYQNLKKQRKSNEKKIAVFTAIVGNYDFYKIPLKLDSRFDYFVFTNQAIDNLGFLNVRPLPYISNDNTRSARYIKTHPHTLLKDYDLAIWVDASIVITEDIYSIIEDFKLSNCSIGAVPHPARSNVFQEAKACILTKKDNENIINSQINFYRNSKYSGDVLIESGLMISNLKDKKIDKFFTEWWKLIDSYSKRDQLSFGFAAKKSGISIQYITERPNSIRNHPFFILMPHESSSEVDHRIINKAVKDLKGKHSTFSDKNSSSKLISINNKSIDVIVCVHNALNDVVECLESIEKTRINKKVKLIIIDDGSEKETTDYLKNFKSKKNWVSLHRNEVAQGYTKAANKGLRLSKADLLILTNSDTIVTTGWTEKMATAVFSTYKAGIVGPLSSAASHQSIPEHKSKNNQTAINKLPDGLTEEIVNKKCEEWTKDINYPLVPLVHGFCFGITKEVIKKIGYFDENNFPRGYGEENDYCFRAVDAGFGLVLAIDTYIFHEKSKSYNDSVKRIELMKNGAEKLAVLHGKDRVMRSIQTMQQHPTLIMMRDKASKLYSKYEK